MGRQIFIACTCFILIGLFVYTATSKMLDLSQFYYTMTLSPLLKPFAGILTVAIPGVELILVGLLMVPRTRKQGLVASGALLGIFTSYVAYMLLTESHLPCSCGGIVNALTWQQHLVINATLTMVCAVSIQLYTKRTIAIDRDPAETLKM